MQVFVDDIPVTDVEAGERTVGQLIDAMRDQLQANDRLVVQVECDGRPVSREALDKALGQAAKGIQRLDFQTESAMQVARAALESIAVLLSDTDEGRSQTVEQLALGNTAEAMNALGPCVRAWQRGFEGLIQVAALRKVPLDQAEADGQPILEHIRNWSEQLRQIKQALEEQDFVLLADILQYEFESTADQWRILIQTVAREGGLGEIDLTGA